MVQMLDFGVAEHTPYIVMELLDGTDLSHALRGGVALPLEQVATIVQQVAKALARAHDRGIVHRDIKPENIFLCNVGDGETFVKLLDFGVAKSRSDLATASTRTGAVIGTPYYMSPEQIVGAKTVDHRTDLWALGVVAFECLTAQKPFDGETIGALTLKIHQAPPLPSAMMPGLLPSVDAWFARACAQDPEQRFASAREMSDALQVCARERATAPAFVSSQQGVRPDMEQQPSRLSTTSGASMARSAEPEVELPVKRGGAWLLLVAAAVVVLAGGALLLRASAEQPAGVPAAVVSARTEPSSSPPAASSTPALGAVPVIAIADLPTQPPASRLPSSSPAAAAALRPAAKPRSAAPPAAANAAPSPKSTSKRDDRIE